MIVNHKIAMDLIRQGVPPRIDVMQDDKYSRNLEISLYENGVKFSPPENCTVLVRYSKPDGKDGAYDTLPDGTKAWSITENKVTVALAPQVCTTDGRVSLVVMLLYDKAELSCFEVQVDVHKNPRGVMASNRYVNISGYMPQPRGASVGQYLQIAAIDHNGVITEMKGTEKPGTWDHNELKNREGADQHPLSAITGLEDALKERPTGSQIDQMMEQVPKAFYVTATDAGNGDGTCTVDKTLAEVEAAKEAGKSVFCNYTWEDIPLMLPLVTLLTGEIALFSVCVVMSDTMNAIFSIHMGDDGAEFLITYLPTFDNIPSSLPAVTEENNGAFLRVVDGAWAAATMTNAEEVAF